MRFLALFGLLLVSSVLTPAASAVAGTASLSVTPTATATAQLTSAAPLIRYVAGSTVKLEQLLGEEDKELHKPTLSQTVTRYGIQGTDLGYSFDHDGRLYFLFGDTVGRLDHALDTIATTDATDPEQGVRLDFLTVGNPDNLIVFVYHLQIFYLRLNVH